MYLTIYVWRIKTIGPFMTIDTKKPLPLKAIEETYESYSKKLDQTSFQDFSYLEQPLLGYEEHSVQDSLVNTLKLALYFSKISLTFDQICEEVVKTIKSYCPSKSP